MDRQSQIVAVALVLVAGASGIWMGTSGRATPLPPDTGQRTTVPVSAPIVVVHVAGWVAEPGLVEVPTDARVADAILAAGGIRPGARVDALNLAEEVFDGRQIVVPGPAAVDVVPLEPSDGRVRLNQATAADLETLPGVGPVLAARIIAYREANGPFRTAEDLLDVAGIGEAKLEVLRDLLIVP